MTFSTGTGSLNILAGNKVAFTGNTVNNPNSTSNFTFFDISSGSDLQIFNNELPKGNLNFINCSDTIHIEENIFKKIYIGGVYDGVFYGSGGAEGIYIGNNEMTGGNIEITGIGEEEIYLRNNEMSGGNIEIAGAYNVIFEGNTVNNPSGFEGNIIFAQVSILNIIGNTLQEGNCSIYLCNGHIDIQENRFKNINIGGEYEGDFYGSGNALGINIAENDMSGGITVDAGTGDAVSNVSITGNTFYKLSEYYHDSGSIYCFNVNNLQILKNNFQGNGDFIPQVKYTILSCNGEISIEENSFTDIYMGGFHSLPGASEQSFSVCDAERIYIGNNIIAGGQGNIAINGVGEKNKYFCIEKNSFPESYPSQAPGGKIMLHTFESPSIDNISGLERIIRDNKGVAGIYLGDMDYNDFSASRVDLLLIEDNEINVHYASDGILVRSGSYNVIRNNTLTFTDESESDHRIGIGLGSIDADNEPEEVSDNIVVGNTIEGFRIGIGLFKCENNIIFENQVKKSREANVWVGPAVYQYTDDDWEDTVGNRVFNNYFKQFQNNINVYINPRFSPQSLKSNLFHGVIPDGTDAFGVSRSMAGNYYSDYDGEDYDRDGLGDTPHLIKSSTQANAPGIVDPYPLMPPGVILSNTRNDDFRLLNKLERFNVAPAEKENANVLHFSLELPNFAGEAAVVTDMEFFYNTASDPDYWSMGEEEEMDDLLGRLEDLIGQSELPPAEYMKYLMYNALGYLPGPGEKNEILDTDEMNTMQQQWETYTVQYLETKEGCLDRISNYELTPAEYGKYLMLKTGSPLDETEMQQIDAVLAAYAQAYDEKYQGNPPDPGNDKIITGMDGFNAVDPSCINSVRLLRDLGGNQTELVATGNGGDIMGFAGLNETILPGQKVDLSCNTKSTKQTRRRHFTGLRSAPGISRPKPKPAPPV